MTSDGCVNTRDNGGGANCSTQLEAGESCQGFLKWKDCDRACSLCACSTASGTIKEHCSGHGICRAVCSKSKCIDDHNGLHVGCECDSGWSGKVCQNRKLIIA